MVVQGAALGRQEGKGGIGWRVGEYLGRGPQHLLRAAGLGAFHARAFHRSRGGAAAAFKVQWFQLQPWESCWSRGRGGGRRRARGGPDPTGDGSWMGVCCSVLTGGQAASCTACCQCPLMRMDRGERATCHEAPTRTLRRPRGPPRKRTSRFSVFNFSGYVLHRATASPFSSCHFSLQFFRSQASTA